MNEQETITVFTSDATTTRRQSSTELKVEVLAQNVNIFLSQIEGILEKAPAQVGKFKFKELTVSAAISAKGGLVLLGTGVEASVTGGMTFKFEKS